MHRCPQKACDFERLVVINSETAPRSLETITEPPALNDTEIVPRDLASTPEREALSASGGNAEDQAQVETNNTTLLSMLMSHCSN